MTLFRVGYSLLVLVTIGIYLTMVMWVLPKISAAANGLIPFDMRPTGYTHEEAINFLQALSVEGRDLYLGLQHTLDTLYPGLLAIVLVIAFAKLATPLWAAIFGLFAIAGNACDYLENIGVKNMLAAFDSSSEMVTLEMVATVSDWTVFKSAATSIAYIALLVLLIKWAIVKVRTKSQAKKTANT